MKVFRITLEKWCKSLAASGYPARWSSKGNFMIYTAETRSLACLENLVHRSGEGENNLFKVMLIEIPDSLAIRSVELKELKKDWQVTNNYSYCQEIGNNWLASMETVVLKVPSVIIKMEHNYLINPHHPDFKKIKLLGNEDFVFDSRF